VGGGSSRQQVITLLQIYSILKVNRNKVANSPGIEKFPGGKKHDRVLDPCERQYFAC
jgi:hypothetical protein